MNKQEFPGRHLGLKHLKHRIAGPKRLPSGFPSGQQLWLAGFILLPYASYGGLLILAGLLFAAMGSRGQRVWRLCGQYGFGWLSAGLLLSASFGINRGDGFLQLTNFLPFFVFWGVLATHPKALADPFRRLETMARWLLVTSIPLSAIAVVEYVLKFEQIAVQVQAMPLPAAFLSWLYEVPSYGHRAHSLFNHPNGLSAYLVMILGLGLGLALKALVDGKALVDRRDRPFRQGSHRAIRLAVPLAVALCLAAIFCTGSRNGLLIALVLVAIALYAARRDRWAMLLGLGGSAALVAAALSFGIGGRSLSLAIFTQDPRIGVWRLTIEMIRQRPWLGWGFSGLRELYIPYSIPDYEVIHHAHNVWLFLASEAGIPVMLGFCWIVGRLYYTAIHTYLKGGLPAGHRAVLLSYLLAFTACLLFCLFDVVLFDSRANIVAGGLLAALYLMSPSTLDQRI
ncbi:MAG: O-antigen ligase family protein [Phormidesmis sp.]